MSAISLQTKSYTATSALGVFPPFSTQGLGAFSWSRRDEHQSLMSVTQQHSVDDGWRQFQKSFQIDRAVCRQETGDGGQD